MFTDLLDEIKGFKYQVIVKILLKKYKSTEIQLSPVYFNSLTKIVINNEFDLEKAFQKILCSMNLVGLLNHLILNTLIFQLADIYYGVLTLY